MAALPSSEIDAVWAELMQEYSAKGEVITINKHDLRAAVVANDQWISDNAASGNAALPQPARSNLTTPQKAMMHTLITRKRYLTGAV